MVYVTYKYKHSLHISNNLFQTTFKDNIVLVLCCKDYFGTVDYLIFTLRIWNDRVVNITTRKWVYCYEMFRHNKKYFVTILILWRICNRLYTVAIQSSQIFFGIKNVTMLRRIETVTISDTRRDDTYKWQNSHNYQLIIMLQNRHFLWPLHRLSFVTRCDKTFVSNRHNW